MTAAEQLGHPVRWPLFIENVGWVVYCDCHFGDVVGFDPQQHPTDEPAPAPTLRAVR